VGEGQLRRLAEANDRRGILRAAAPASLLMSAAHQRHELHALADVERHDPLGAVQLVPRQREHVDLGGLKVNGDLADRLHGVGVEQRAAAWAFLARSATGNSVPVSLLAHITDTTAVCGLSARLKASVSSRP
jgi:hypothetical protein